MNGNANKHNHADDEPDNQQNIHRSVMILFICFELCDELFVRSKEQLCFGMIFAGEVAEKIFLKLGVIGKSVFSGTLRYNDCDERYDGPQDIIGRFVILTGV